MDIGTVEILLAQRDRWKREAELMERAVADDPTNARALFWRSGGLAAEWARRFPELFDEEDCRLVITQGKYGWHFVEWAAAILLYHRTSYRSLIGKYEFKNHPRKHEIAKKVLPPPVLTVLLDRTEHGGTQGPDILFYAPDLSDWLFCEVKGPNDHLGRKQEPKFAALATASGKRVRLLSFKWAPAVDRLFHIARLGDWEEAQREGAYRFSTVNRRLAGEGFIHLSFAHQVKTVADALYSGRNDLLLLAIDPAKLNSLVVVEDLDGSGKGFPHAYGELNLDAVTDAHPLPSNRDGTFPAITNTRTEGSAKPRENLSYAKLTKLAAEHGVGELYDSAVDALGAVLQKRTTRSSIAFKGTFNGSRKVVLSLIPGESSAAEGLRYQLYKNRLAELVKPSGVDVGDSHSATVRILDLLRGRRCGLRGLSGLYQRAQTDRPPCRRAELDRRSHLTARGETSARSPRQPRQRRCRSRA